MIVSHHRKFIFIKPMKVAGTSIEIALSKHCGRNDILSPFNREDEELRSTLGYVTSRNYKTPIANYGLRDWAKLVYYQQRPRRAYSHTTAHEVRKMVGNTVWSDYTKISVVRNPYDYIVSQYFWRARHRTLAPFQQWLVNNPDFLFTNRRIMQIDGKNHMDFIIRYEHFEEDLTKLSSLLKLNSNLFDDLRAIKTKTSTRPKDQTTKAMFANFPDGIKLIQILCRDDIEEYHYAPP